MFEVMIIKRGRSRWEWRVCDRDGAILIHGWESTRRAAKYRGDPGRNSRLFAGCKFRCGHHRRVDQFDCGRIAGLNRTAIGAYSKDVRATTNFRGTEKSRFWLGGRYPMVRWRNGSNQGLHYRA